MKSRSRSLILEEFLTAAGYKEPTFLEVSGEKIVMEESDTQTTLSIALTSAGYVEGRIYSEKGQVQPSVSRFSSDDFTEGTFSFTIEKKTESSEWKRCYTNRYSSAGYKDSG